MDRYRNKIVAFAGHRYEWQSIGVEEKLLQVLEELINKGYTIFYDGNYGAFDNKCRNAILKLKNKYPNIKLVLILTYYHHDKEKYPIPSYYDDTILPEIEDLHYKQKITKRNEWIIDNCDLLSVTSKKPTKAVLITLSNTPKSKTTQLSISKKEDFN